MNEAQLRAAVEAAVRTQTVGQYSGAAWVEAGIGAAVDKIMSAVEEYRYTEYWRGREDGAATERENAERTQA